MLSGYCREGFPPARWFRLTQVAKWSETEGDIHMRYLGDRTHTTSSPVPGILQARTLEWVAIAFSNA